MKITKIIPRKINYIRSKNQAVIANRIVSDYVATFVKPPTS